MRMTFEQFDYDIHQLKNGGATKDAVTTLLKQASEYLGQYEGDVVNKDGGKKVIIFAFSGHGTSRGMSQDQIKTNDGELLGLMEEIRLPLVKHETVREIPKLFFIDACRGSDYLQHKVIERALEKGFTAVETNFRIDFATIPDHKAYSGAYESTWMPVLARELRERDEPFSIVVDRVNQKVHKGKQLQQPQTVSQLNVGPFKLYYKTKQFLRCSKINFTTVAKREHTMWFDDDTSQTSSSGDVTVLSDERPTLPELMELDIPQLVGTNYEKFGTLLLNDDTGIQVESIEAEYRGNSEKINTKILREWLKGRGSSVTWNAIVTVLRKCNLTHLADQILASKHASHWHII